MDAGTEGERNGVCNSPKTVETAAAAAAAAGWRAQVWPFGRFKGMDKGRGGWFSRARKISASREAGHEVPRD